jgi:hypothetical protein
MKAAFVEYTKNVLKCQRTFVTRTTAQRANLHSSGSTLQLDTGAEKV